MKFFKEAVEEAKKMPKAAWVAAVVLPGGFTVVGLYLAGKGVYRSIKEKKEKKND
jgi:hypothetical protein